MYSMAHLPSGMSEKVAEEALRGALRDLCRGGSWEGVVRGVTWQAASTDARDPRSIEMLTDAAEAIFASLIDQAVWAVERVVVTPGTSSSNYDPEMRKELSRPPDSTPAKRVLSWSSRHAERVLEALRSGIKNAA